MRVAVLRNSILHAPAVTKACNGTLFTVQSRRMVAYAKFREDWMKSREMAVTKRRRGEKLQKSTLTEEELAAVAKLDIPSNFKIDDESVLIDFQTKREVNMSRSSINPADFKLPIYNFLDPAAEPSDHIQLDPKLFGLPPRSDILHEIVRWQRAKWRKNDYQGKTRAEVVGTGKKLRQQKGLGMARMKDGKAPHFRKGGVAHGPKPVIWQFKLNKKLIALGMRVALSTKWREGLLRVIDDIEVPSHKTGDLGKLFEDRDWVKDGHGYFIGEPELNDKFKLASRNLPYLTVASLKEGTVYDIMNHKYLYLTPKSIEHLQEKLLVGMMQQY